jgi:hypothetical protein
MDVYTRLEFSGLRLLLHDAKILRRLAATLRPISPIEARNVELIHLALCMSVGARLKAYWSQRKGGA